MPHKDLEEGIRCVQTLCMPGTFCMPLLNSCSATTFCYSCYNLGASGLQMQLRSQNNVSSNFRLDGLRFSKTNDSFTVRCISEISYYPPSEYSVCDSNIDFFLLRHFLPPAFLWENFYFIVIKHFS